MRSARRHADSSPVYYSLDYVLRVAESSNCGVKTHPDTTLQDQQSATVSRQQRRHNHTDQHAAPPSV